MRYGSEMEGIEVDGQARYIQMTIGEGDPASI